MKKEANERSSAAAVLAELGAYCRQFGQEFERKAAPLLVYVESLNAEVDRVIESVAVELAERDAVIVRELKARYGLDVPPEFIASHSHAALQRVNHLASLAGGGATSVEPMPTLERRTLSRWRAYRPRPK